MIPRRLFVWQCITVATLFVGYAGYYVCRSNLAVASKSIIAEYADQGFTKATTGGIASFGVLLYAIGKCLNGPLADRFGGRRVFLLGMAGSVACTVAFALGNSRTTFALAFGVNRFIQSAGWGALLAVVMRWFPQRLLAPVMGVLSMSYLLGDGAARLYLGQVQAYGYQWRGVFVAAAVSLTAILAVAWFTLKASPTELGFDEPQREPTDQPANGVPVRDLLVAFVRRPMFWVVCSLSVGLTLIRETFNFWSPTYMAEVVGLSEADASKVSGLFPLVGAATSLAAGALSYRLNNRHGRIVVPSLIGLVVVLTALAWVPLAGRPYLATALLSGVFMFLMAPYTFVSGVMSLDLGGKRGSSTAAGLVDGAGYFGATLSGRGIGALAEAYGWMTAFGSLAGVAGASLVVGVIYLLLQERTVAGGERDA